MIVKSHTRKLLAEARGKKVSVSPRLSSREWSVLVWLNAGLASKEIAAQLGITVNTVNYHLANIYRKLEVHSRVDAANVFRRALYPAGMKQAADRNHPSSATSRRQGSSAS